YKQVCCFANSHIAWSNSVDLPAPGCPPISTAEPGTKPPPSTRSSSAIPVVIRGASSKIISSSCCTAANVPANPVRVLLRAAPPGSVTNSVKVFQLPQAAHCPCHFG